MERPTRLWTIPGIVLCVGLALSLRWLISPDVTDSDDRAATPAVPNTASPSPIPVLPAPEVTASAKTQPAIESDNLLHGRIFDAATRAAVKEFEVRLQVPFGKGTGKEKPISRNFRSNTGQFSWKAAPVGTWHVTLIARGYQHFQLDELRIAKGETTPEIVAPLLRGHRLTGRVFDEASDAPIKGAHVTYREAHLSRFEIRRPYEAASREDGSFVLDGVPAGRIIVAAFARNYAYRELEIVSGEETPRVEIGLSSGGLIVGQLTEADGTPIAGSVSLQSLDGHNNNMSETNAGGEFTFRHLQPGRYLLQGRAGRSSTNPFEVVLAENERMDSLVLALASGRSVRGVVRGVQPEHAFLGLRPRAKRGYFSSQLDARGAYAMHGVPAGKAVLTIHIWGSKETWSYQSDLNIDVPADTDLTVNFDVPSGTRLSGRVTQGGMPKAGSEVWARPVNSERGTWYSARSSDSGAYEIEGLGVGEYEVQADQDIARRIRISGDTELDLELPTSRLAGHIVEEGTLVPIVGSGVHLINMKSEAPRVRLYKETDHTGGFNMTGFQSGELLLSVYKPGYEMLRERVTYGTPISGMTIRLRPSAGVEISVVDAASGRGVREVFLSETIGQTEGIGLWVRLNENGSGSLPGALAGSTLKIRAPGGGYASVVIPDWNAQPLELRLKKREND
jgi:hypothetical protein